MGQSPEEDHESRECQFAMPFSEVFRVEGKESRGHAGAMEGGGAKPCGPKGMVGGASPWGPGKLPNTKELATIPQNF